MIKKESRKNSIFLPGDVDPVLYKLEFITDLENFTFAGKENVALLIKRPTSSIIFHAVDLDLKKINLTVDGRTLEPKKIALRKKKEQVTLDFGKKLEGQCDLYVEFEGKLNDKMHGFYRTSYNLNGVGKYGAATQFEATDARRAFPCWDEPARKAKFAVSLVVPEHMTALSNMPIIDQSPLGSGLKRVSYATTPVMSTYLLAFVIADLESLEATDRSGVPIRVWTTPGKREHARFSLECLIHTLPYFSDWFGIPYALPKLDMVSLPDFAAGAMENWGLITYRETAMLVDPENSAVTAKQRVAEVVDHELAHQWFGNLVTMEWWDDLWLNEGFASYMGPKAVDHQFPAWDTWTQYVADDFLVALHKDSLKNTHPVEVPVENPYEISELFDAITYRKGSVVNRMIEHYLGEGDFRKGLNVYLERHSYGNAKTADLWKALEDVSKKPVRAIMDSYTRQPGYPVVSVTSESKGGDEVVLTLRQRRFIVDGSRDKENLIWKIPVGILASKSESPVFKYMENREMKVTLKAEEGEWIKLNPSQSGFYRTRYSDELLSRLVGAVESEGLGTVDRLGFLDDVFALSRAGYNRTSQALSVLRAYRSEDDFSVWTAISRNLRYLHVLLTEEPWKDRFHTFAREVFTPIAHSKGWDKSAEDSHLDVMLRSLALRNLGGYGDEITIREAKRRFENYVTGGSLDPDLRSLVYSLAAENGGEEELGKLLNAYDRTELHEEKNRILAAIGHFQDEHILRTVLEFAFSEKVRPQDLPISLGYVGQNPKGRSVAWEFVKEKWQTLMERYHEGGLFLIGRIIEGTTTAFTTRERHKDVSDFFKTHKVPGAKRTVKQALETIALNIAVLKRDREDIREWLEKHNY